MHTRPRLSGKAAEAVADLLFCKGQNAKEVGLGLGLGLLY